MNLLAPVSDIMTRNLITVDANDSFFYLEKLFDNRKVHHLPVLNNEKLVGMVSKSDYLFYKRNNEEELVISKAGEKIKLKDLKASHIMTRGLAKLDPNDRINIALEIFKENIFHAILIVENDQLVGILSTYDIIFHLAADKVAGQKYIH